MTPFLEKRYERKYTTKVLSPSETELVIMLHPALFSEKFPPRFINNIYFDTPDFKDYQDSVQGVSDRRKIRIRWYGESKEHIEHAQLELKYKNGTLVSKERYPLISFNRGDIQDADKWQNILKRSEIPASIIIEIQDRSHVVLNRYHRKYFLTPDDKFRITFDSNMESHMIGWFNKNSRSLPSDDLIIELKYGLEADLDVGRIARFLPFTLGKNSKYLGAVECW
jgi:hypothetical protein